MLQKSDSNVILSPLSVKIPLTLLAEAAGLLRTWHQQNNFLQIFIYLQQTGRDVPSQTQLELSQVLPDKGSLFDAKDYYKLVFDSLNVRKRFKEKSDNELRMLIHI